jgi:hypothetical protein
VSNGEAALSAIRFPKPGVRQHIPSRRAIFMRRILLPIVVCFVFSGCGNMMSTLGPRPSSCEPNDGNIISDIPKVVPDRSCDIAQPRLTHPPIRHRRGVSGFVGDERTKSPSLAPY